jgi:hypothetical protein
LFIIRIIGGLGNQMFQYAFGMRLAELGYSVKYDTSQLRDYKLHNGFELERVFGLTLEQASARELRLFNPYYNRLLEKLHKKLLFIFGKYLLEGTNFSWNRLKKNRTAYLDGYWQSLECIPENESALFKSFAFNKDNQSREQVLLQEAIANCDSVSVHVRLGDYLDPENQRLFGNICTAGYYRQAMEEMEKKLANPVYYVFSDSPEKAKDLLASRFPVHFIQQNQGADSYKDMLLMSLCRHNIIANSSFSWWAAFLNKNPGKIVIAPKHWRNMNDRKNLVPSTWIKL